MHHRARLLGLCAALLVGTTGCLSRTLPIPPPGAMVGAVTECPTDRCPNGGVEVVITGTAREGALVIAENTTRMLPDGSRYSASTYATGTTDPDGGASGGTFRLYLGPVPNAAGAPPTVCQHGDAIVVYQFVRDSDNRWEVSNATMLTVP